jgi:radical SAM superfamily enzyme YgiQ (UPF0313 family)
VPALGGRHSGRAAMRQDLLTTWRHNAGFYVPSFYEVEYRADGRHRALRAANEGTGAPAVVRKAALADDPGRGSSLHAHLHARHRVRIPVLVEVVRGCANLCRSAGPGTTTSPSGRFRGSDPARAKEARAHSSHAAFVSIRSLRSSGDRSHPDGLAEMGTSITPASLRLDDLTETSSRKLRQAERRRWTIAPETGSIASRVINKDGDQRRDPRPGRAHLRQRHREPEALYMIGAAH